MNCLKSAAILFGLLPLAVSTMASIDVIHVKGGEILTPESSQLTHDATRMHTNYEVYKASTPLSEGETPGSLACVYHLLHGLPGCPISQSTQVLNTGSKTIALVVAYDNPSAEHNLAVYSEKFGLPECTTVNGCFKVKYSTVDMKPPPFDKEWAVESSLDIEMAHAMAPQANIILVEAQSSSADDLFHAVDVATRLVNAAGGGEVSMSWGGALGPNQVTFESYFNSKSVLYFSATGDNAGPAAYPACSPHVISVGGSTIVRNSRGMVEKETAWSSESVPHLGLRGGSGGPCDYFSRPIYQDIVQRIVGVHRGAPDVSFVANPGVKIFNDNPSDICTGWCVARGTSVSSAALAGIFNSAGGERATTQQELAYLYTQWKSNGRQNWRDITEGKNDYPALPGYDFTTGIGTPLGFGGK